MFVDADQQLEAELELVLLHDGQPDEVEDPTSPASGPHRRWVVVGGWIALAAMAISAVVPTAQAVWQAMTR